MRLLVSFLLAEEKGIVPKVMIERPLSHGPLPRIARRSVEIGDNPRALPEEGPPILVARVLTTSQVKAYVGPSKRALVPGGGVHVFPRQGTWTSSHAKTRRQEHEAVLLLRARHLQIRRRLSRFARWRPSSGRFSQGKAEGERKAEGKARSCRCRGFSP